MSDSPIVAEKTKKPEETGKTEGKHERPSSAAISKPRIKSDPLATEYKYYGAAVKNLAPALSSAKDRERVLPWMSKLFGAEYHVNVLRDKRNRYLAALAINMLNDELNNPFAEDPPIGALQDLTVLPVIDAPPSRWELDTTWSEFIASLPEDYEHIPCSFPGENESCKSDTVEMDEQLDNEFWFLLYQIRPYAAAMPTPEGRSIVAAWMQALCRLSCSVCNKMKGLRNDYAYALYGYAHDLRLAGPFQDYPPLNYLKSLPEATRQAVEDYPLTSLYCEEADSFVAAQPAPEEGAFCYIAVTGELAKDDAVLPH